MVAAIAQLVERLHGKEEVPGSNPGRGSLERAWRDSSVGQSARLIFVMSGVQIPPPLPRIIIVIVDILTYLSFSDRGVEQLGSSSGS